jgi:hypothetical protein
MQRSNEHVYSLLNLCRDGVNCHNSVYAQVQHSSQARVVPRMVDLYPDSG